MAITYQLRDLARAREILSVLARHGFGQILDSMPLSKLPGLGLLSADEEESHPLPTERRLVQAFEELGPTFVKLGQMLSTRQDLLPAEYIEAFSTLQDHVGPFPGERAQQIVEEALDAHLEALFDDFTDEPVASASIAQVHKARLHTGEVVAVKVQRPGIERTLRSDINILYMLAELMEGQLDVGIYTPTAIVEAFDRAISLEIDFLNEATNAESFGLAMSGVEGVFVPRIYRSLSSRRVLTLEWVDGVKLSAIDETDADRRILMRRLVEATYEQLYVHSVFHADPHPGNLVVGQDSTLIYLDFGLMGRITPEMRDTMEALFVGIIFGDAEGVARAIYRAGSAEGRVPLRELAARIEDLLARYSGTSLEEQDTGRIAVELLDLARDYGLRLPHEYALLARTSAALDGIARATVPGWDMMAEVRPYASRLAAERLDPERVGGEILRSTLSVGTFLREMPRQVEQVLTDLERGNFQLNAEIPGVDRLDATIDRVGRALVFGVGVSAFLVSASILVAAMVLRMAEDNTFGVMDILLAFLVIGSILAASGLVSGLLWNLFIRGQLKKIKWGRFRGLIPGFGRDRKRSDGGDGRKEG
jgi:ubiquinone biosynthesis protein